MSYWGWRSRESAGSKDTRAVILFFKQKTAYEVLRSLVGSEMCIRDSALVRPRQRCARRVQRVFNGNQHIALRGVANPDETCLLYTSDAADDLLCVDLGGRRIIQKKTTTLSPYPSYYTPSPPLIPTLLGYRPHL